MVCVARRPGNGIEFGHKFSTSCSNQTDLIIVQGCGCVIYYLIFIPCFVLAMIYTYLYTGLYLYIPTHLLVSAINRHLEGDTF